MSVETGHLCLIGGAGFIGSHAAEAAIAAGYRVTIVDDFSTGTQQNLPAQADVIRLDVRDDKMGPLLRKLAPQIISIHAAQKSISTSVQHPGLDASVNIVGLLNILQGSSGASHVLFASSGGALARSDAPAKETDEPRLRSPYAISKRTGEHYVAWFAKQTGVACTILRYANGYGPRQHALGDCGVIPIFAGNLMAGRRSYLHAWPDQMAGAVRDYVHVSDLARAHMLMMTQRANGCFHLGTGVGTSTQALYEMMAAHVDDAPPLIPATPRPGDPRRAVLNCDAAYQAVGWRAEVDLSSGIKMLFADAVGSESA